ncbi:hypothetical protein [Flavilitoribacter nigricans]|uniref:Uncharacterized protein n=1 Tax=Flavilitoribacter nigricans (strain ATCC 23147 / DSM 23189 / NBRC 102662 / NCIMB 1420 / SS-2) TaxID=1122177 RepID=A0A2D0NDA6_FLAN2|nr:hypothetical protein [Flavilitoribacter nigricans]PHN06360.1 hypothetical protein CRP01_12380 [Flavilitoribacter nigricans DSM 23189 = NBRC 102662]
MNTSLLSIPKDVSGSPDRDYDRLREEGRLHIERLANQYWTEYNASDPGITLLEVLCYALTDLGMRIGMPVEDLLASKDNNLLEMHRQFHSAIRILPNAPLTPLDYRKLLINIRGVKNAWLSTVKPEVQVDFAVDDEKEMPRSSYQPFPDSPKVRSYRLRGLNAIKIEYEDELRLLSKTKRAEAEARIKDEVRKVYQRNRNLCEDLVDIQTVAQQEIVVCGEIELEPTANAERTNARMLRVIQNYLTPSVRFYSLEEMLADPELSIDSIFKGPLFMQDTLAYDALLHALIGQEDLLTIIQDQPETIAGLLGSDELLDDPAGNLDLIREALYDQLAFHGFIKDEELRTAGLRREVRVSDLINLLQEVEGVKEVRDLIISLCEPAENEDDCKCGQITNADLQWKICLPPDVQPVLCFTGSNFKFFKDFLPVNVRKTFVKQLWLAEEDDQQQDRFDQRLQDLPMPMGRYRDPAKYYSLQNDLPDTYGVGPKGLPPVPEEERPYRLAKARQLKAYLNFFDQILATYFAQLGAVKNLLSADKELKATYFTQAVESVKDLGDIFVGYEQAEDRLNDLLANYDDFYQRRHQQLDHLIARFAERFSDYAFMLYDRFDAKVPAFLIGQKEAFLRDYPSLSSRRACAYNYYESLDAFWDTDNVSGLQRRLGRLAGFDTIRREDLFGVSYEFYQEVDVDDISEFRWRIRDNQAKIILSSSRHYKVKAEAVEELELTFEKAQDPANMTVKKTQDEEQWYFNVEDGAGEVIGRRIEYFNSEAEAIAARDYVADFLSGKHIAIEGMYVIEHILLRPDIERKDAPPEVFYPTCVDLLKDKCQPLDPYSFRVSIVLPGWTRRFGDPDYRQFLERLIRLETPAHIMPKICWIGPEQMRDFEQIYRQLLEARANQPDQQVDDELLTEFLRQLDSLRTVYWPGTLHDCVDEGEEEEDNPVVLNRTFLGNLQNQDKHADND